VHLLPEIVVRVRWHMWSESGRLRFPVFLGVRDDVDPRDCHAAPEAAKAIETNRSLTPAAPSREGERGVRVARMLPYVVGRPLAIARTASDEAAPAWAPPKGAPSWLRTVELPARARARRAMVIDGAEGLEWLASKGAASFFVAATREAALERADWLALDLDARAAPPKVFEKVARATKALLEELGLPAFAMTTGKDALRVLAPLGGVPWKGAGALAELVVRAVALREPKRATSDPGVAKAGGRVFLDASASLPFAPLVAPWSPRASGHVAAPVDWDSLAPTDADPMLSLLTATIDYPAAVKKVAALFG
jgi:bifunctional non-homologous end joining protein LigD